MMKDHKSELRKSHNTAIIIGAGFGGLSLGIRLQSLGFNTIILEKLDAPGGRAYVKKVKGFIFDMGPTVITVPHFIEELFALERAQDNLDKPDFPEGILLNGNSKKTSTEEYAEIVPIKPFYRIYFHDKTYFDYDGDPVNTRRQIQEIEEEDLEGYERFHRDAEAIFKRGFLELGYTFFGSAKEVFKVLPDLLKLDAVRSLFSFTSKYFKSDKLRQVFSFETLLVGGNPLSVPAIYSMIHFVEKTWGVHYVMGGTGALINGMVKKYHELGGQIKYNSEIEEIIINKRNSFFSKPKVSGVQIKNGELLKSNVVVSNGDYANTYMHLIKNEFRRWNKDWKVKKMNYSMSLVVIYFGFKYNKNLNLRHHNIILGPRYEELLSDIFKRKILAEDFSQYLHIPTLTDKSLAPKGHHAAYTLIPVPNNASNIDWSIEGSKLTKTVLSFLDKEGYIPDLLKNLVHSEFITPNYFEHILNSHLGNSFGVEPRLTHSAFFRPHNKSEDIEGLYLVGASSQPGAGTPSVMMSAKMTARIIANDFSDDLKKWRGE
ncbi:phytoene desaturase family protein [Gammaproteobacteria bacterium]|nr:phytoene desaturase family protein [Gammaproteobacteria bacterium]